MKIVFSWDDGSPYDEKLFDLHNKYKIPGMFFIPTQNREGRDVITSEQILHNESEYVSFGGHTMNHTFLTDIPLSEVENEVAMNKAYLEAILGHSVNNFCLPGGKYNSDILSIIFKHYDTVRTADTMCMKKNNELLKPTLHFYRRGKRSLVLNAIKHWNLFEAYKIMTYKSETFFDYYKMLIDLEKSKSNRIIIIWGHSWEIEENELWGDLEDFMTWVNDNYRDSIVKYDNL